MKQRHTIQIRLTPEQQMEMQKATGQKVLVLQVTEMESRLAPSLTTN
jgi:hypothetical protein